MKKYLLLILISVTIVTQNNIKVNSQSLPLAEVLDLKVDGSGNNGVNISLTTTFSIITRLIVKVEFETNDMNLNDWGNGTSLVNGTNLYMNYSGSILELTSLPIKRNGDFGQLGYELSFLEDDKNPKSRIILSLVDFLNLHPYGLDNRSGVINDIFFHVQDNLTVANTSIFSVAFLGCINCYTPDTIIVGNTVTVVIPPQPAMLGNYDNIGYDLIRLFNMIPFFIIFIMVLFAFTFVRRKYLKKY